LKRPRKGEKITPQGSLALSLPEVLDLLQEGEMGDLQLVPWGSNYTFAVSMKAGDGRSFLAIYKPGKGEAPLWDFQAGTLYKREFASFLVSEALGWRLVPPTVIRLGPHGVGSLQLYIEPDPDSDYAVLQRDHADTLRQIALFDLLANNADRKASHCFRALDGKVWAIDHGLTFHAEPKLRTVIWDFRGEPIPGDLLSDLKAVQRRLDGEEDLRQAFGTLLEEREVKALGGRLERLLATPAYPLPPPHRALPWPPY
jgi:uncharacterized repeat protein (TIGR03843 family)